MEGLRSQWSYLLGGGIFESGQLKDKKLEKGGYVETVLLDLDFMSIG
jgi:hypothetical protein